MNNEHEFIFHHFAEALEVEELLSPSEWVQKYIHLSSQETEQGGLYDLSNTPYVREIIDVLGAEDETNTITVMKSIQLGFTTMALAWHIYCMVNQPANFLWVNPSERMCRDQSNRKLRPMLESVKDITKGKISDINDKKTANSATMIQWKGGTVGIAHAGSAVALRGSTNKYLILDEMSAYPSDVADEGDPIELAKNRTHNFSNTRKVLQISTPSVAGSDRTEEEFKKSDQRYYFCPCPHCGELSPLVFSENRKPFDGENIKWKVMKWDKDEDGNPLPETAHLLCEGCGNKIEQHQQMWMMSEDNGAQWIPTAVGEPRHKGYSLNSLYSFKMKWSSLVRMWLEAKKLADRGDKSKLKGFIQSHLGQTWEIAKNEVSSEKIITRREVYKNEVPYDVSLLVAGVDTQREPGRFEISIVGFGEGDETWLIDHQVLYGDPNDISSEAYKKLGEFVDHKTYRHESGVDLPIHLTAIDTGGGSWINTIRKFVMPRRSRNVYAIKGSSANVTTEQGYAWKTKGDSTVLMIGTNTTKLRLFDMMGVETRGAGYIHFPVAPQFDQEYFEQLSNEQIIEVRQGNITFPSFKPIGRNEALDCLVYAFALYQYLKDSIPLSLMRKKYNLNIGEDSVVEEEVIEEEPTRDQVVVKQQREKVIQPAQGNTPFGNFQNGFYKRDEW